MTLGFFPEGAFDEHASKQNILSAVDDEGRLMGYLLFRSVTRGGIYPKAVIVHLCIDSKYRNESVAKYLVEQLCGSIRDQYLKIELACRRDYDLGEFWGKLGFVYCGERPGRSGKPLTKWEISFRQLPLLKFLSDNADGKKTKAVVDANIFGSSRESVQGNTNE